VSSAVLRLLVLLTLLLSAADHWTTWLCLRGPVSGWEIREMNPFSEWLFLWIGVGPGLLLDSGLTLCGLGFLALTARVPRAAKLGFLSAVVLGTGFAVANNLDAISRMGLPLASF
jgi:hypothetical protein